MKTVIFAVLDYYKDPFQTWNIDFKNKYIVLQKLLSINTMQYKPMSVSTIARAISNTFKPIRLCFSGNLPTDHLIILWEDTFLSQENRLGNSKTDWCNKLIDFFYISKVSCFFNVFFSVTDFSTKKFWTRTRVLVSNNWEKLGNISKYFSLLYGIYNCYLVSYWFGWNH